MSKKSTTIERETIFSADELTPQRRKHLSIKQIRAFVDKLRALSDSAPLPDWSDTTTIGDRFAIALRLIPPTQWADLLGKSEVHLRRYENGVDIPLTVVAALAAETEIPLDWIVSGRSVERRSAVDQLDDERGEDVPVQKLSFKAAAGPGALIMNEHAEHIRFPRAILQHVGLAPQNARLMEASGESMRPTISDGDLLLVDVSASATVIVEGKIYVFAIGDEAYVKRLRRIGERIVMISDNRDLFPEEDVPRSPSIRIFGRVKWAGRSL
ncbi:transcriptional regulator [Afipia sp. P52-10]|uniref:S24 family peptidase n=1 Tax=Afipia sp. P52-10 TaxID=1429916 RepID=UPI0003DEF511|nr:S24 family peptidase [Afipia sp. P52-10]ETR79286.1 transcriptional regulator [Afipia sp. P52-10]